MKIVKFAKEYLEETAQFSEAYSERGEVWSIEEAKKYIDHEAQISPDFCLVAIEGRIYT